MPTGEPQAYTLRLSPGRTFAFSALFVAFEAFLLFDVIFGPHRPMTQTIYIVQFLLFAPTAVLAGVIPFIQSLRGEALLEASEKGVSISSPWPRRRMTAPWSDVKEIDAGIARIHIQLRNAGIPDGSTWLQRNLGGLTSAARGKLVVGTLLADQRTNGVTEILRAMQSRYAA
jgi:hypothetical protein